MPWSISKKDGKFCVVKDDDGSVEGCHDSQSSARDQQKALYANENKEKGVKCGYPYHYVGMATSFAEYDEVKAQLEKREHMSELHHVFMSIVDNIIYDEETVDKSARIRQATEDLCSRMDGVASETMMEDKETNGIISFLVNSVKSLLGKKPEEKAQTDELTNLGDILFYKGNDDETLYWVTRYSNKYRDDDVPAEIISSTSHAKFAALVNENIVAPPDLWYWHEPDWRWGVGQWAAYDSETGFALAGGLVLPDAVPLAKALSAAGDEIGVSHGMPAWSISRDELDGTIITEHITQEVSPLPKWAAANKMTSFTLLTKEKNSMALSKGEKARLSETFGVTPELLSKLDALNEADAKKAAAERESKEGVVPAVPDGTVGGATPVVATPSPAPQPETPEETDAELKSILKTIMDSVIALNAKNEATNGRIESLASEVKALKATDEQKIADKTKDSPLSSLASFMAQSVIGHPDTRLDGRTALAKSGPTEAAPEVPQYSPFPWINQMIASGGGK